MSLFIIWKKRTRVGGNRQLREASVWKHGGTGRVHSCAATLHRFAQSSTQSLYTIGGADGHRPMHADKDPPGQPDGGGGPGGDGGAGGAGGPFVDPIAPHLMLPYLTVASGLFWISVAGSPEVVAHGPRATPGALAGLVGG
eukprot:m.208757 g.208757  ORF g.208757 m.208757 type:complete len:141 (-) comp15460_c0_seq1:1496-1918(-)